MPGPFNYAIITGDIVDSSQVEPAHKSKLMGSLKGAFSHIGTWNHQKDDKKNLPQFDIFRGDSFQGALSQITDALKAAIFIRTVMRKSQPLNEDLNWDARLAIGLGPVDHLPDHISEGDGPAYQNSGPVLDNMKGDYRLAIKTPWREFNEEFEVSCALLDAIIAKWTAPQAEVIWFLLQDKTAKKIASELDISQAAVHYRIKGSGWFAVEMFLERYETLIKRKIL